MRNLSIHGHRGARGHYPENTITGFIEAVKCGVDALEIDVVVSKDLQVVVSHEPWMNSIFCTLPDGGMLEENPVKYNLYNMTYEEISRFDCGIKLNPEFPLQKSSPENKPLLTHLIRKVESFLSINNLPPVIYNIEVKSAPAEYDVFQPQPKKFACLLLDLIVKAGISKRVMFQSFDANILKGIHVMDENIDTGLLVENEDGMEYNLRQLDFVPTMYNPEFILVNQKLVDALHARNIKIIPWTVNETKDMRSLIDLGVDGLITDFPCRAIELKRSL
ncbi:MAG: glycerophosphodiester phosphodiesterase [Bacteroidetes bacterium]|nr:glycerophosphodiester phosphodiesterase [Bacteroidota bacterium]